MNRGMRGHTLGRLLLAALPIVSFAQMPPSESANYAAKVVSLSGAVSVLRDNQSIALDAGDFVQVQQIIISGPDGHALFQVSDGSTFEVFPGSRVVFRKNPPNWRDLIDLLVGRVKIHIQKWGDQPNPNRIHTPTAVISVRGTTFDVSVNQDDESTLVEVEEGAVEVQHALLPTGRAKVIGPGESITVYKTQPLAKSGIDRGTVAQHVLRALQDAIYTAVYRTPRTGGAPGGVGGGPGGTTGSTNGPAPPTAPPGSGGGTAPPPPPAPTGPPM